MKKDIKRIKNISNIVSNIISYDKIYHKRRTIHRWDRGRDVAVEGQTAYQSTLNHCWIHLVQVTC